MHITKCLKNTILGLNIDLKLLKIVLLKIDFQVVFHYDSA